MEKNLILLSRIRSSLSSYEVRAGTEYNSEEVVLINLEQFPVERVAELKALGAKVIAYCGHKNIELSRKAKELGADLVVPNSQIVQAGSLLQTL
jgi:NAD(P)H-dependent flavin oxidoreductase YrpB (nitropropane dioxygenase family)